MERECMEKINTYCQKQKLTLVYANVRMTGPSHDPEFTVVVKINNVEYGTGTGKNKKEAKAVAAKKTWEMIEKQPESPSNMQASELMTTQTTLLPVPANDYVSQLNMYSQRTLQIVDYPNTKCTGEAHAPMFSCSCTISGFVYGSGTGTSVAAAKQAAAKQALEKLHKQGTLTMGREESNGNSVFTEHSNSSRVPTQSDSDSISFEDSAAKLVEKMKDMAVCEKPSPSQRDVQSSALKSRRKLAANFDNARNKEEEKKMSDLDESLPDLDTNTSEENESPYTVNKRNVKREVKELARLDHENIVRYYCSWKGYDHVTYPDSRQKSNKEITCLFIQMELCEQGPLENWIEKNRLDRKYHEMAQNKFLQILKGVKYIHSKELVHRDLKPQNIFISHEDKIKIGDFGLVTSVAYGTLTENRGTKSYMAPEQFGDRYGKEVDIYALGLIWFEILSAFSGHEKIKVWHDVREGQLPESFTKQFPVKAPIIKKMLSRDPSGRYSASEILEFFKSVDKDNSFKTHTR
ncbi:interferon-induced, double-stranded RNA-activated protein kinase isoform X3 [Harpia harpyja]|uniref:interferon-induced, double-stranded RNA-activated protein kinase isoform X3 n=1 Tax=Harpia harpyja TaxID=202280 RepID=UPI0022B15CA4|nr:interferon-induced, double-stranded RNA-activated protein kinase isoform X3 [Harpia harpyja]